MYKDSLIPSEDCTIPASYNHLGLGLDCMAGNLAAWACAYLCTGASSCKRTPAARKLFPSSFLCRLIFHIFLPSPNNILLSCLNVMKDFKELAEMTQFGHVIRYGGAIFYSFANKQLLFYYRLVCLDK